MATYFDTSVRQPSEVWRALRRRRARPPVPQGSSPDRVRTFQSALEQAEQQFRAAASVDYDSRALNLYYGASQAGRALAAAATTLNNQDWTLSGHGLRCPNLAAVGNDVTALSIRRDGKEHTSFQRLSQILGSPLPENVVTLGQIWPLLFETTIHAPLGDIRYSPMVVSLDQRLDIAEHGRDAARANLPPAMRQFPVDDRPPLAEFLGRYPALRGWVTRALIGSDLDWPSGDASVLLAWDLTQAEAGTAHVLQGRLTRYRGHQLAFPTIQGQPAPMHPLMAWWAVLYALSMVTRYEPAQWTTTINVNTSPQTTAIEFVLDTALAAVPDLLDEAIDLVATTTQPP